MTWILTMLCLMSVLDGRAEPVKLDGLGFLHGAWAFERGGARTEEYWSPPRAGTMLGASRTIRGEKTVFFEYFRIEQRGEELFYIAQPGGRPPTEFKLTSFDGNRAVFENPQHDFPTKIVYERIDDKTVKASIEGEKNGRPSSTSWEYKRF